MTNIDITEFDFERLTERATRWGASWQEQADRFENWTPGKEVDAEPSYDWRYMYDMGENWTAVVLGRSFLDNARQGYEILWDTDHTTYWILTNHASAGMECLTEHDAAEAQGSTDVPLPEETDPLQLIMSQSQTYRRWLTGWAAQVAHAKSVVDQQTAVAVPRLDGDDDATRQLIAIRTAMLEGFAEMESVARAKIDGMQQMVARFCELIGVEEVVNDGE